MYYLRFDLDPKPKGRPRAVAIPGRGTVMLTDKKTRLYEKELIALAKDQFRDKILEGPLKVELNFNLKKPKTVKRKYPSIRPDLDNYVKAVLDSLNSVVFKDDGQIVTITASKYYASESFIEVALYPLS